MKKFILQTFIIIIIIGFSSSCASRYNLVNPQKVYFQNSYSSEEGMEFSYKYDVLRENGNDKQAKKEAKKFVRVVAVKLTNNTDSDLIIGNDLVFYAGNQLISPMMPFEAKTVLKQSTPTYLLYLLLTPTTLITSGATIPIGLILGPGITAGNMLMSNSANKNLYTNLEMYNIFGTTLKKGETISGLISFRGSGYEPIYIELK